MTDAQIRSSAGVAPLLERLAGALGPEAVRRADGETAVQGPNAGMYAPRRTHAVVGPGSAEQAAEAVRLVAESGTGVSVHAFSTGFNWGLGSRESADHDVIALDLAGLSRVRSIDSEDGWAVIEPGVSQGRLASLLEGSNRMLNVTSASAHTSVLGNALDRGVGMRGQRTGDLLGLEAVLPDGEVVRTGWWPGSGFGPVYAHGLGPSLTGLLTQSNLAVVTAAAIRLRPRPEAVRLLAFEFEPSALEGVVDRLRRWVAQGMTRSVPKLYDRFAARPYGGAEGKCLMHVCVDGAPAAVEALGDAVLAEAIESGLFTRVVDGRDDDRGELFDLVERSYMGDPDVDDEIFERKMRVPYDRIDAESGFLLFLPLVPFRARDVAEAARLLQSIRDDFGLACGATAHPLDAEVIDYVVNVRFPRDEEGVRRAHRALEALYRRFGAAGYAPYRLDVDHAEWRERFAPSEAAVDLTRRIKGFLDPDGVLARGRYA
ncbi:FAD-binding oxidoreductase [Glycomyces xiaoerkulensis]|uniref:FAD-binding oxidoreductase n=1 Tax=Glycomyces xiaoerkulensis TaxID=2038139 RepID=UPI0018E46759|nr:FAD-binding oxidoreductase [Glycomyces xiaoerkulensis]